MIEQKEKLLLSQLFLKFKDQTISPQEFKTLETMLQRHPEYIGQLTQIIEVYMQLNRSGSLAFSEADDYVLNENLWKALAEAENKAPAIHVQQPVQEEDVRIQRIERPKMVYKLRKSSVYSLMAAVAAVFLIAVFVRIVPVVPAVKVAQIRDSMNAKWSDNAGVSVQKGTPLFNNGGLLELETGLVEILFNSNARVVIEAPASFQIPTDAQVVMQYGKVYAKVPQEAAGFTITTQTAQIIDLGTAFGVEAGADGDTSLHVMEGKTILRAGRGSHEVSMEVNKDDAKKVSGSTLKVSDIVCDKRLFVRSFDSDNRLVWRGQAAIDLADVVGGGDGFGTGTPGTGVNPATGDIETGSEYSRRVSNQYVPVPSSLFIDGIFVPNNQPPQIVSSAGHPFVECPETESKFYANAKNTPDMFRGTPVYLDDAGAVSRQNPFIFLHANLGITFDLEAFRKCLPDVRIDQFKTDIGISKSSQGQFKADFWVLIDGQVRYLKKGVETSGPADSVQIQLADTDRFLTLVTTDGGPIVTDENSPEYDRSWIGRDWCIFSNPLLHTEQK